MLVSHARVDRRATRTPVALPADSITRYAPAAVLLAILVADSNRHTDPDLWGHVSFGQVFIAGRHLLHHDTYSYSAAGHAWRDHEWLAEVVMAFVYNTAGVVGIKLWKFACTAIALLFVADTEASTGAPPTIQLAVLFAAAFGFLLQAQLRPQMFSFCLLGALLALLARDNYRRRVWLWLMIPLMALWANLHGGFFVGLAALAVYTALPAVEDLAAGNGLRRAMRVGGVAAGGVLATLFHPNGIGNWFTVIHTMHNPLTRAVISEWQPLLFKIAEEWHKSPKTAVNFALVIVPFAALALCFVIKPRGGDLALVVIAAMMGAAAYLAVRNMGLAVIASTTPLCRHAALALKATRFDNPAPLAPRKRAHEVLVGVIALLMALSTGLFSGRLSGGHPQPHGAVEFMQARGLRGNVLGDFAWGEYLIFHLAPESRVFVDSRYDMVYPQEVLGDYLDFFFVRPRAAAVLDAYPHDFVLIPPTAAARTLMERRADWKLIYSDSSSMLFARAGSAAARLKGIPVQAQAGPNFFP